MDQKVYILTFQGRLKEAVTLLADLGSKPTNIGQRYLQIAC